MNIKTIGVFLCVGLGACTGDNPPQTPGAAAIGEPAYRSASYQRESSSGANAGRWAVAVIGTPFYLVFKTAVCGASVVIAAPVAAFMALSDSGKDGVNRLGDGVAQNCGPPYVLSPS